ncbi:MAG: hypothetical protein K5795_07880 [Lachnospiraceae bacterium]|nr:hypothetical protein [Lachnospiraceae bacterium]
MIKKLLLTLKYGEKKARMVLSGVLVLLTAGAVLLVLGIIKSALIPLGLGALLLIAGLLVLFSFSFVDIDVSLADREKKNDTAAKKPKPEKKQQAKDEPSKNETEDDPGYSMEDIDFSMLAEDLSDLAIGVGGLAVGDISGINDKDKKDGDTDKEKKQQESDTSEDNTDDLSFLDDVNMPEEKKKNDISTDVAGKTKKRKEPEEQDEDDDIPANGKPKERETVKPTPKQIKARRKMLRVRRDDRRYTPVFIDSWNEASAHRVPAFIQDKGKTVNIVLVEGALRTELMPMKDFLKVTYKKNVEDRMAESYDEIRNDKEVSAIFGDLLPALYPGPDMGNTSVMYKNLYILGGKIAVTPRSLRKMINKFDFEFNVFDSLNLKGNYSKFFKMAYENRIFWTDNVITQNDYQERIRGLLQSMVEDENLSTAAFENDLAMMVRYNLITKEYADYYSARKTDKIRIRI